MFNNHRNNNWCRPKWLYNLGFEDLYTVLTVPSMIHMGFEGFADSLHFPLMRPLVIRVPLGSSVEWKKEKPQILAPPSEETPCGYFFSFLIRRYFILP